VILKIPIAFMIGVIWWALRDQPTVEVEPEDGGGEFRRRRANVPQPRGPRRGPGEVMPKPQAEVRVHLAPRSLRVRAARRLPD